MDNIRIGKISSSGCFDIVKDCKKKGEVSVSFFTYIKRKNQEFKINRHIGKEDNGTACKWGNLCEDYIQKEASDIIGLNYTLTPNETLAHPIYSNIWVGSRDGISFVDKVVMDLKCPFALESFCEFADLLEIAQLTGTDLKTALIDGIVYNGISYYHKDGEKYYWQLVSNACISNVDKAELVIFCPTLEQLNNIINYAIGLIEFSGELKYSYFTHAHNMDNLPYIPNNSRYNNVVRFLFDVPKEDKEHLTNRVIKASEYLLSNQSEVIGYIGTPTEKTQLSNL